MSTTPPPEPPTEPIRPVRPVHPAPAPLVEERVVTPAVDPNIILLRLEDAIGSLRTGLVIVGVIAVAALAVGLYALLGEDDSNSRRGLASDARVSRIDERVDRLSRQVQTVKAGGADASETDALADRVESVERTVRTLAGRPAGTDPTQAIEQLSARIDTLASDVEKLKQAAQTTP